MASRSSVPALPGTTRKYGDRIIALKAGEIVFDGSPALIDEARFMEIYGDEAVEVEIR